MILLTCLLALSQPQPPAAKPAPPPPLPAGRYTVLKVSGDLDSDNIARTTIAELDRARGVDLVILELDGNRARPDVVARIGARIKAGSPNVAVWLRDGMDKRVGVGQTLLGAFATASFIDPDTHITAGTDDDLRWQAPPDTSWESIETEVTGPLWVRLTQQSADQKLPKLLLNASHDAWGVPVETGKPWVLSNAAPAGGTHGPQPRQVAWADGPRIDIDAEAATGLCLCTTQAKAPAPILSHAGLAARSARSNRSVTSGLNDSGQRVERIVDDAKLATRRIGTTLAMKPGPARPTVEEQRRAGQSALDQIDRALRELDRADSMLTEFPELNRTREKPKAKVGPMRATIDGLRKELDKHRTTARDFASR